MKKFLVAFDLDGTLISWRNSWEEIRKRFGIESSYYDYLSGRISFSEMKKKDAKKWRKAGVRRKDIEEIAMEMKFNPGVEETFSELKKEAKVGIISAAPATMVRFAAEYLEADFWCSSRILFDSEGLVRGFSLPLCTPIDKAQHFEYYCYRNSIPISRAIAVGDSEIDKEMLELASMGIVFNPCTENDLSGDVILREKDLSKVLEVILRNFFERMPSKKYVNFKNY